MIVDWIYSHPTWLWGSLMLLIFTGGACAGLVVFHNAVHLELRKAHNELAGFTVAIIAVVYAVLLAFIAIATWESFTNAEEIVQSEADYVSSIYRDTEGLPAAMGQSIRTDLRQYVDTIINKEWPTQRLGETPDEGWAPLHKLHGAIVTMHPQDRGEQVLEAELLKTLNELYRARESRLSAVEGHIPYVIWWIIFLGGAIVTGYTYLFGFHSFRMHLVMTASVATSLVLVVILFVALDWPFRGEVSIEPSAFIKAEKSWTALPFEDGRMNADSNLKEAR
jgi:ABC-type branched-subunit amino acid transport system permease subunit